MTIFAIITEGSDLDQFVETRTEAGRESRELKAMGFRVRTIALPSWEAANIFEDRLNDGMTVAAAQRAAERLSA